MEKLIPVGKLTRTHALKGALKMRPFNISSNFLNYTDVIYLGNNKKYKIKKVQSQNGVFILTLDGVNTIEDAQMLQGNDIFIEKSLIPINKNEILLADMIGFEVIFNNKLIGKIFDFADYNAGLLYIVKNNNEKYYLPDSNDFIEHIDYTEKKIFFKDIEELLD